jgi:hypothetical protein
VPRGESPDVSVTARNDGDLPTVFVAALNREGGGVAYAPIDHASIRVPPGESITWEPEDTMLRTAPSEAVGDDQPDMTYHLRYVGGHRRREVRVVQ